MAGRFRNFRVVALSAALALGFGFAHARAAEEIPVDVELVLAVDVSLSMSPEELDIQREGYASGLTDQHVLDAIRDGVHGKIAVTYVEWAGDITQRIVLPWTLIETPEDAERVAARLSANPPASARRTSISGAIGFSAGLFDNNGFAGMKRVIDISGDGPNNQGIPVVEARDSVIAEGITINGLPLMTNGGRYSIFSIPNLDIYYTDCVIGGPGAFMVPVNDWSQFPDAIRRKLVLELARADSPLRTAEEAANPPIRRAAQNVATDCMIGEKIWGNRDWMWDAN